jgi:hypothetical protein
MQLRHVGYMLQLLQPTKVVCIKGHFGGLFSFKALAARPV